MLRKIHFTHTAKILIALVVVAAVIGFTERHNNGNVCSDIVIKIDNQHNNYFVDEADILSLMTARGEEVIIGNSFDELNLKAIEQRVNHEPFIKDVQIYKDLKGNMLVHAELRRPYARVLSNKKQEYIAMDGTFLPVSSNYTTRAIILSGKYFDKNEETSLLSTEEGELIYEMLNFIYNDKFWKAQIAQIAIDEDLNMVMYPQVTKQKIEFGTPENYRAKFKKLKIFYKRILPQKGWNSYERVNLKYKDQIIAE